MKKETYEWFTPKIPVNGEIHTGDIRIVNLQVKVLFEWSDKIVTDHGYPESDWVEYTSGWVMKVISQSIVYNDEPTTFVEQAMLEK